MPVHFFSYDACPSCHRNIDGLYGRFVDPADPIKDCPHCGVAVTTVKKDTGILIKK